MARELIDNAYQLTDLNARLVRYEGGRMVPTDEIDRAHAVIFECPSCDTTHYVEAPFLNTDGDDDARGIDADHRYYREGETIDTLTLHPSVLGACAWHGWVEQGHATLDSHLGLYETDHDEYCRLMGRANRCEAECYEKQKRRNRARYEEQKAERAKASG